MALLPANPELVISKWIATMPSFTASMVATSVPRDTATWATSGFISVGPLLGGNVQGDLGSIYQSLIQVSSWAVPTGSSTSSTSNQPPWWKAAFLIETVVRECYVESTIRRQLDLGARYRSAYVLEASPITVPRRINGEPPPLARYDMDLSVLWAELPEPE